MARRSAPKPTRLRHPRRERTNTKPIAIEGPILPVKVIKIFLPNPLPDYHLDGLVVVSHAALTPATRIHIIILQRWTINSEPKPKPSVS